MADALRVSAIFGTDFAKISAEIFGRKARKVAIIRYGSAGSPARKSRPRGDKVPPADL